MEEKKITMRKLCTRDLFPMMKIMSKIGIGEFRKCFDSAGLPENGGKTDLSVVGMGVMLEAADVLLKNIGACEKDIYSFLADLSGMKADEIPELDLAVFAGMIHELVTKEEFRDFFTAVSKLFPKTKTA